MRRLLTTLVLLTLPLGAVADERTRALADHIRALETNKVLDDVSRIQLMYDAIIEIADHAPDAEVAPLLERHARTGYRVPGFREDDGHRIAISTHDTASAAKFALQQWERQRGLAVATGALASGDVLDFDVPEATLAGYAQAFANAGRDRLQPLRAPLAAALDAGAPVEPLTLILVERLHDVPLASALLAHGRAELVVHMLPRIGEALSDAEALPVLVAATARDELASAAVLQIGRLAASHRAAHDWLLAAFDDRRLGASAAAALAKTGDPIAIASMADKLNGDGSTLSRSRAALGLKLSQTRAARAALERFAADPDAPPELQAQVRDWLR